MSPLYRFDMDWFRAINVGWHSSTLDPIFLFITYLGLGEVQTIISLCLLIFRKTRPYALPLLVTLLLASFTSQIPKRLIDRDRPSLLTFAHAEEAWRYNSFPSGHTLGAFACAFMVFYLTRRTKNAWIGWVLLFVSCLVGISRVYRGVHWPTDVIGGMFIGCGTASLAYLILSFFKLIPNNREDVEGEEPAGKLHERPALS